MRLFISILLLFSLFFTFYLWGFSPATVVVVSVPDSATERFLARDCANDLDYKQMVSELRREKEMAEKAFIALIERGPSKQQMEMFRKELAATAERQSALVQEIAKRSTLRKQGSEAKPLPLSTGGQQAYLERRMADLKDRLAVRALEGLAVLETASARRYLIKVGEGDSPLREIARELASK